MENYKINAIIETVHCVFVINYSKYSLENYKREIVWVLLEHLACLRIRFEFSICFNIEAK
jgi:hypothetical protein